MKEFEGKTAVITGAASGIGEGFGEKVRSRKYAGCTSRY